jgi:phage FluMu protein Com
MLARPDFIERFRREARMMAALNNPHVVPVTMVGEHNGIPYIVMPFLPGGSLSNRRLRDESGEPKPMHPSTLHLWLPQVAAALDYVHSLGVVHRDVKPGNVFFDAFWHAYLGDFGISKIVEDTAALDKEHTLTATSMAVGTQEYMAPELFAPKPQIDGRVDQYALAVMVYEMLAGRRPFTGDTAHLIVEVTTKNVPPLRGFRRDLPRSLEEAVDQSLAKHSGDRFESCLEFVEHALADVPPMQDEPDMARLLCPACENLLKLPTTAAGKKGRCPRCKNKMEVAADLSAAESADQAGRALSRGGEGGAGGEGGGRRRRHRGTRPSARRTGAGHAAQRHGQSQRGRAGSAGALIVTSGSAATLGPLRLRPAIDARHDQTALFVDRGDNRLRLVFAQEAAELALRPLGKLQIGADQIDNARLAGPVIHFQQPAGVAFAGGDYLDDFAGVASGLARRIDAAAFHVTPHIPRPPMGRKHRRFPA